MAEENGNPMQNSGGNDTCANENCIHYQSYNLKKEHRKTGVMDGFSVFMRKNWFWITGVLIIFGAIGRIYVVDFAYKEIHVSSIIDNQIRLSKVVTIGAINQWVQLLFECGLTLGLGVFISVFIVKAIEKSDQDEFESHLKSFQKNTAKDAILAVYNNLIPVEFTELIKRDVFEQGLFRLNANWDYSFEKISEGKGFTLTRIVSYSLHNTMNTPQTDKISATYAKTPYIKSWVENIHQKKEGDIEFERVFSKSGVNDGSSEVSITLAPGEVRHVAITMKQEFDFNRHIGETHFTKQPIIGLRITVHYPVDYTFDVGAIGFTSQFEKSGEEPGKRIYEIKGAIFRGQGFEFSLHKTDQDNLT